jgi:hypothetical protein
LNQGKNEPNPAFWNRLKQLCDLQVENPSISGHLRQSKLSPSFGMTCGGPCRFRAVKGFTGFSDAF